MTSLLAILSLSPINLVCYVFIFIFTYLQGIFQISILTSLTLWLFKNVLFSFYISVNNLLCYWFLVLFPCSWRRYFGVLHFSLMYWGFSHRLIYRFSWGHFYMHWKEKVCILLFGGEVFWICLLGVIGLQCYMFSYFIIDRSNFFSFSFFFLIFLFKKIFPLLKVGF